MHSICYLLLNSQGFTEYSPLDKYSVVAKYLAILFEKANNAKHLFSVWLNIQEYASMHFSIKYASNKENTKFSR